MLDAPTCDRCNVPLDIKPWGDKKLILGLPDDEGRTLCWECFQVDREQVGDPIPPRLWWMAHKDLDRTRREREGRERAERIVALERQLAEVRSELRTLKDQTDV